MVRLLKEAHRVMSPEQTKSAATSTAAGSPLPHVSICLLTYNCAKLLPRSIDSLLAQSHGDFELIVNDDCSTDGTEELCRSYARRDARVRYFKNPTNLRFAENQNAAILRARSDYVALVHQGDVYRSDMIEKWTRALVKYPTAALVFNALEQMDQQGKTIRVCRHPYSPLVRGVDLFDEMIRRTSSPIFGIVMVRRRCVWDAGPFDPRLPVLADVDMWLRLLLRHDAAYVAELLMRTAPRDPGHPTEPTNWPVRREHELIYALNSARRYPGNPATVRSLRRAIAPMLWKMRFDSLAYCLWHRNWSAAARGVAFMRRYANFATDTDANTVLDWEGASRRLEATRDPPAPGPDAGGDVGLVRTE
jgi:glycosyltransferase involved in cell wall biosynthesis